MGNYKVVFRDDGSGDSSLLKWEPGCPAMVTVVQVARNVDTSAAYLQIKIENLSADILNSISGVAHIDYIDGSTGDVPFSELDFDLPQCEQGALKATALPRGDVESAFIKLLQIDSQQGKWHSTGEPAEAPERELLSMSEKAMTERDRQLKELHADKRIAAGKAQFHHGWWVCACGCINVWRETCRECECYKDLLSDLQDEESLCASADKWSQSVYNKADALVSGGENIENLREARRLFESVLGWEDAKERAEECSEKLAAIEPKSEKRRRRLLGVAAVFAVLFIFFLTVGRPLVINAIGDLQNETRYREATSLYEDGHFRKAYVEFRAIAPYGDSARMEVKSAFSFAENLEKNGDLELAVQWYKKADSITDAQDAEYKYVKDQYDSSDSLTKEYLDELAEAGYGDAAELRSELYRVSAKIIVNTSINDTTTSLTEIASKSMGRPYVHAFVDGGDRTQEKVKVRVLEEHTWGVDGIVKEDYSQRNPTDYTMDFERGWNTIWLRNTGSNVYDHRVTLFDPVTGETLASAEFHTPYN